MSSVGAPLGARLLSRRGVVPPFYVMELVKAAAQRAATGREVFELCVGQPSTSAPAPVLEAARAAVLDGPLGYTEALGVPELREAVSQHYLDWYGVHVPASRIAITTGSSAAFAAVVLAAVDAGDEVLMTRPGYPAYRNTLQTLGCRVTQLDCGPGERYQPSRALLEEHVERTGHVPRALIIASPGNPTGTLIAPEYLAEVAAWCREVGCLLVSDEIYHGITFTDALSTATAAAASDQAVVIGSFSKFFSMTGWRVGWAVLPEELVRPIELILANVTLCAPAISQVAALAAFTPDAERELRAHVRRYAANRELLLRRLPELGVTSFAPPDGAFYGWFDVSHLCSNSLEWCLDLLGSTGVALAPGVDFAPDAAPGSGLDAGLDGSRFVRLSLCGTTEDLDEAITRMVAFAGR